MSMEPVILALLNEVLNKPTGGIDWSSLTPKAARGSSSGMAAGTTTVYTFTGEAYLTGYSITAGAVDGADLTATLYIDGTAIDSIRAATNGSTWAYRTMENSTIWHIQNELKIEVNVAASNGDNSISWALALSVM